MDKPSFSLSKIAQASIADLLINISAGWFGLAFAAPFLANENLFARITILIFDIIAAILFLYIAIRLRRKFKK